MAASIDITAQLFPVLRARGMLIYGILHRYHGRCCHYVRAACSSMAASIESAAAGCGLQYRSSRRWLRRQYPTCQAVPHLPGAKGAELPRTAAGAPCSAAAARVGSAALPGAPPQPGLAARRGRAPRAVPQQARGERRAPAGARDHTATIRAESAAVSKALLSNATVNS